MAFPQLSIREREEEKEGGLGHSKLGKQCYTRQEKNVKGLDSLKNPKHPP